jgi:biotin carboxyl carrier protein
MNLTLHLDGQPVSLEKLTRKAQEVSFTLHGKHYHFRSQKLAHGGYLLERETAPGVWQRLSGDAWSLRDAKRVQLGAWEAKISEQLKTSGGHGAGESPLSPTAPMPGLVRQILVKLGEKVTKGQPLVVMEAMKLQTTLSAGGDGVVEAILAQEGEMITEGTELVRVKA